MCSVGSVGVLGGVSRKILKSLGSYKMVSCFVFLSSVVVVDTIE